MFSDPKGSRRGGGGGQAATPPGSIIYATQKPRVALRSRGCKLWPRGSVSQLADTAAPRSSTDCRSSPRHEHVQFAMAK